MTKSSNTRKKSHREQGQTIVLLAAGIFALLGMLAIVTESGFIYIQKRSLQNAADAAALAGAQRLPGDSAGAIADSQAWATKNVSGLTFNGAEVFDNNLSVRATVKKKASTAFIGALSFGEPEISAKAVAKVRSALLLGPGVVPISISESTLNAQTGGLVTLKETGGSGANGNYGLISVQGAGPGGSITCEFLKGGSTVGITDPGTESKPGNVSSLHNCLPDRMSAALANTCYTMDQVAPLVGGVRTLLDRCNPLIGAQRNGQGIQPTSVIVIPIMTDASFNGCSGRCDLDIVGAGTEPRRFAFFRIDATTVEKVGGVGPTCNKSGQCLITGTFIANHNAAVYAGGQPVGDYTANTAAKVVQLVE